MADALKTFYQNQLPSSVTTLATVPGAKAWDVRALRQRDHSDVPHYRAGSQHSSRRFLVER